MLLTQNSRPHLVSNLHINNIVKSLSNRLKDTKCFSGVTRYPSRTFRKSDSTPRPRARPWTGLSRWPGARLSSCCHSPFQARVSLSNNSESSNLDLKNPPLCHSRSAALVELRPLKA
ncbi:hypothetical protein J6590_044919 [Homalodisca vitripennis]|nr:hypothetical protein J6590_044919 [Homalodisca vitripennis]